MSADDVTPAQLEAAFELERMLHPDRAGVMSLLRDASAGLAQAIKAINALESLRQFDLPDDVRGGILHMLPLWHSAAAHQLPRMIESIRLRIAALDAKEATARAIEGGEA